MVDIKIWILKHTLKIYGQIILWVLLIILWTLSHPILCMLVFSTKIQLPVFTDLIYINGSLFKLSSRTFND